MQIVIDANIVLAGLLRDSTNRMLILHPRLYLHAPDYLVTETERRLVTPSRFRKRLQLSKNELSVVLSLLFANIHSVPYSHYKKNMKRANTLAKHTEDAHYLALALHLDMPIWSHDRGMAQQEVIEVITTKDVIKHLARYRAEY